MAMNMQIAYHYRMLNMDAIFSSVFNNLPLSRSIIRRAIQQTLWVERNGILGELTWKKIKNFIEHWDQAFWNYLQVVGCNTCSVHFRGDIFDADTGRREYSFKRTIKYDSHMLDKPDFVGSYEVGDHVYFFFREMAVEYMNCGRAVYSRYLLYHPNSGLIFNINKHSVLTLLDSFFYRVARVCKRDTGGKNILAQNWATYLKVRLNCSIPGEFPFFFNEIQDVYKAGLVTNNNKSARLRFSPAPNLV